MPNEPSDSDPRAELGELAHALGAELKRRAWYGARSVPVAKKPVLARIETPQRAASRTPPFELTPAARPNASKPAAPASFAAKNAAPSSVLAAAAIKADEIRREAASSATLSELAAKVAACTACGLCRTRKQTVFADGRARVSVLFVGEAPGEQEDLQGLPFVGRAGQLLTDIITRGMGLTREDVYIANVLKCRPPDNRDPSEAEKLLCTPWLDRQIELVDPKVIIPLGRHAAMHVLGVEASMSSLRGRVHVLGTRKVIPTFHPAYLLRDPSKKKECWQDIQLAMAELGLKPPAKSTS